MTIVEMCVHMDCDGCKNKIKRALEKLRGVDDVDIDLERQKVTVTGWADQKKVLKAVRKTGRWAVLWTYPANSWEYNAYAPEYYHHLQRPMAMAGTAQHLISNAEPRSYNYYKHGYETTSSLQGYYMPQSHVNGGFVDEKARGFFSDENPNSCSVM